MWEPFEIGCFCYDVKEAWWSIKLSDNKYINEKPNAMYLIIKLIVRNESDKPSSIPPFKLIDENGAEYQSCSKGYYHLDSFSILENLNPGVQKEGCLVFDIPRDRKYKLKVFDDYFPNEEVLVDLQL